MPTRVALLHGRRHRLDAPISREYSSKQMAGDRVALPGSRMGDNCGIQRPLPLEFGPALRLFTAYHIMRDDYLKEALKLIDDPMILVNVVSRRVKQLRRGIRPLVESLEKLSAEDTALREIMDGKIGYELAPDEIRVAVSRPASVRHMRDLAPEAPDRKATRAAKQAAAAAV